MGLAVLPECPGAADEANDGRELAEAEHSRRAATAALGEPERQKLLDQIQHFESSLTLSSATWTPDVTH